MKYSLMENRVVQSCEDARKRERMRCSCEPVQRRHAVDGLEAAARGHHIEAVSAVT